MAETFSTSKPKERALLIAHISCDEDYLTFEELGGLAESAGAEVVARLTQKGEPNAAMLFGKGKVEEMKQIVDTENITLVVSDNTLSGSQTRNISDVLNVKVVDRSSLILDIFALRAISTEGKLQVELAQLKYNLPRLVGVSGRMSKFSGGIGMRGPGEKKLETDKRVIRNQIDELNKRIEKLSEERDLRRMKRQDNRSKTVSLVGYTNTGKSSLLNTIAKSNVLEANKLFATLDPVTRRVHTEQGEYLLTDTVGFINKLPTEFINAFASTLEEARLADLLIVVMDISDPNLSTSYKVVMDTLAKLKVLDKKIIYVYNKVDLINVFVGDSPIKPIIQNSIEVSVKTGYNIEKLKEMIVKELF